MHHEHVFILITDQLGDVHVSSERVALVGTFSDSKTGARHLDKLFTSLEKPRWCKGPYTKPATRQLRFCRAEPVGLGGPYRGACFGQVGGFWLKFEFIP